MPIIKQHIMINMEVDNNMRIENGKFYITKDMSLSSTIRYAPYYSEEQKQWYIIDFGFHALWLGWLGGLAPLFYRFLKLKAFPVNEENINLTQANQFFIVLKNFMIYLSAYPVWLMIKERHRHGRYNRSIIHFNEFFTNHIKLTILMFIILSFICLYIVVNYTPNILKTKNYEYLNIKVKINSIKMIILVSLLMPFYIILDIYLFFYGGLFIVPAMVFSLTHFSSCIRILGHHRVYTGQFICDNEKHNSIYL